MAMSPAALARVVIEGLPALPGSLAGTFSPRSFSLRPLPNSYFMRDSAAVFRDSADLLGHRLRRAAHRVDSHAIPVPPAPGPAREGPAHTGRASAAASSPSRAATSSCCRPTCSRWAYRSARRPIGGEARLQRSEAFGEDVTVFAVVLPRERACIHLDMVFTVVDRDATLVYAPMVTGRNRARVVRIDALANGQLRFGEEEGLLQGLWGAGFDLEPLPAAGSIPSSRRGSSGVGRQFLRLRSRQDHHDPATPKASTSSPTRASRSARRGTSSRGGKRSRTSSGWPCVSTASSSRGVAAARAA